MAAMATGAHSFGPMPMTENVSKEFLVSVLECIRSVLLSTKNGKGLSPKQIIYDYMYLVGEPVPFEKLGYRYVGRGVVMVRLGSWAVKLFSIISQALIRNVS